MLPENSVDAFALWTIIGIFSIIVGNLIYESFLAGWFRDRKTKCPEPCCEE